MFALAELYYHDAGLAGRLARNAPQKNVRPNAAELAALLGAGELDYIYEYESVARTQQFDYIVVPPEVAGRPVTYALSIPKAAPHRATAEQLLQYLVAAPHRDQLRAAFVDMLDAPVVHGTGAPGFLMKPTP
jgi:molybdate/tungstate transport system substrate-binding protein